MKLCFFLPGGDAYRRFAFVIILGVAFGTLFSVFVASLIAYMLMKNKKGTEQAVAAVEEVK